VIPSILVLGLIAGLISARWGWIIVPILAAAWMFGLPLNQAGELSGLAFLVAVLNALVGVALGAVLHLSATQLRSRLARASA
jgi:uncharacterized membrane protein YfcA